MSQLRIPERERCLFELGRKGDVSSVIAYPNSYWVGMSSLGFQVVYRRLCLNSRLSVERAFVEAQGAAEPVTLESRGALGRAKLFALSIAFENDYLNALRLLRAAGVPLAGLSSADHAVRCDLLRRPLVIGGGSALTVNPEPLARFFDVIVLGDGEEVIDQAAARFVEARDSGLMLGELLQGLSQLRGVYVPLFYAVEYEAQGWIKGFSRVDGVCEKPSRNSVRNLDSTPADSAFLTPDTEFSDMYLSEVGRGCDGGCRFCVSGQIFRPLRYRAAASVLAALDGVGRQVEKVGLVGACVSGHPEIALLVRAVLERNQRPSLSSLMTKRVTEELAALLVSGGCRSVALAPEAGSERLRFAAGKRVFDRDIVEAVCILSAAGIRKIRLYFMLGLPTETAADVSAIAELLAALVKAAAEAPRTSDGTDRTVQFILSVTPFIPKPWTPFQWEPLADLEELRRRFGLLSRGVERLGNVRIKRDSVRMSYYQTLMSRGDRRTAEILVMQLREGRDWRWLVSNGARMVVPNVPPPDFFVHRRVSYGETLPWEILDIGISKERLRKEADLVLLR